MGGSEIFVIKRKKNRGESEPSTMLKTKAELLALCWWAGHA